MSDRRWHEGTSARWRQPHGRQQAHSWRPTRASTLLARVARTQQRRRGRCWRRPRCSGHGTVRRCLRPLPGRRAAGRTAWRAAWRSRLSNLCLLQRMARRRLWHRMELRRCWERRPRPLLRLLLLLRRMRAAATASGPWRRTLGRPHGRRHGTDGQSRKLQRDTAARCLLLRRRRLLLELLLLRPRLRRLLLLLLLLVLLPLWWCSRRLQTHGR